MNERLQKLLSQAGIASRREAENIIKAGRVKVNGKVAQLGDKASFKDRILVITIRLHVKKKYILFLINLKIQFVHSKTILIVH